MPFHLTPIVSRRVAAFTALVAVSLSLLVVGTPTARADDRHLTGRTTVYRGTVDGTGRAVTLMKLPPHPTTRVFFASVKSLTRSKIGLPTTTTVERPVIVSWNEGTDEAPLPKYGPFIPRQTVTRERATVVTDRLKDGEHIITIIIREPGGKQIYKSAEQRVTIDSSVRMRTDYTVKLGPVDGAKREATLILKYPADPYERKATITTVYQPSSSCKSLIKKCTAAAAATVMVGGPLPVTLVCGVILLTKGCENSSTKVQEITLGKTAGTKDIIVPEKPPTPKAGSYTSLIVVTDPDGLVLANKDFDFDLGDSNQKGACTATVDPVNKEAGTTTIHFNYKDEFPGLLNPQKTMVKVTVNNFERFNGSINYADTQMDIPIAGLTNRRKIYTAKVTMWDNITGLVRCENTLEIDNRDDKTLPPDNSTTGTLSEGQKPFTWLSGECIRLMEDMKIEAVSCVIGNTVTFLLSLVGITSTGLVVYGGFILGTAQDDAGRSKGKKIITMSLAGLVVVLLAFVIVQVILGGGIF